MRTAIAIAACLLPASVHAGGCFQSKCFVAKKQVVVKEYPVVQKVQNFYAATPGLYNAAIGQANMAALIREQSRLTEQTQRLQEWYQQQQQYQPMYAAPQYQPPPQYAYQKPPQQNYGYQQPQQQTCPTCQQPQQQCECGQCEGPEQQPPFRNTAPPLPPETRERLLPATREHCAKCHMDGNREGDIDLNQDIPDEMQDDVFEAVMSGKMPKGGDRLSPAEGLRVLLELNNPKAVRIVNEMANQYGMSP